MTTMLTADQILDDAKLQLLYAGGVEDWEWYSDAIGNHDTTVMTSSEILDALESGGVDNWNGYSDTLQDFSGYSDYIEDAADLSAVMSFSEWKTYFASQIRKTQATSDTTENENKELAFSGKAEQSLHVHIVKRFGPERADEIFLKAKDGGVWSRGISTKDYLAAMESITKGTKNPIENARAVYLQRIIKNGSLDKFLNALI